MTSPSLQEICCLIGDKSVAGNPTQYMMQHALQDANVDSQFLTLEIAPEALADAVRGLRAMRFRGAKVTAPYFEAVAPLVDQMTETAQKCGSVNCIYREGEKLIGENTEGAGLVSVLEELNAIAGKHLMIYGTGRIARAIAIAAFEAGVGKITATNRTTARAEEFGVWLSNTTNIKVEVLIQEEGEKLAIDESVDVLVQATSISTKNPLQEILIDLETLRSEIVVADVGYRTPRTWLIREAAGRDCVVVDGMQIYVRQTILTIEKWFGISVDRLAMREVVEEFLSV